MDWVGLALDVLNRLGVTGALQIAAAVVVAVMMYQRFTDR